MRTTAALSSLLVLAALGCGSDSTAPDNTNVTCTIALSGALTNTLTCSTPIAGLHTTSGDTTYVSGGVTGTPAVAVNIQIKGTPVAGTIKSTDATGRGFVSASSGNQGWIATTTGQVGNPTPTGSWTLVITSVTAGTAASNGQPYTLHGTLDATMTPFGGGTNLTAHVTF